MMRRTPTRILSVCLPLALAAATVAWAQDNDSQVPPPPNGAAHDETASDEKSGAASTNVGKTRRPMPGRRGSGRDGRVLRHVLELKQLRRAMEEEIGLSADQKRVNAELFDRHFDHMHNREGRRRPFGVGAGDADKLKTLQKEMTAAIRAGKRTEAQELRAQFREMMKSRQTAVGVTTDQFLAKVAEPLRDDQVLAFRKIVKRMRLGDARGRPVGRLTRFWQALDHRTMKLTDEQKLAIREIRGRYLPPRTSRTSRRDQHKEDVMVVKTRKAVFKILTSDQRRRLEIMLRGEKRAGPTIRRGRDVPTDRREATPAPDDPDKKPDR